MAASQQGQVRLRPTRIEDLEFVLRAEQDPENAPFIRQWTEDRHRRAIDAENAAHFVVMAQADLRPVGYVIFCDLDRDEHSVQLKRLVISEKSKGLGRAVMQCIKAVAFDDLRVHRLWFEVVTGNARAMNLYKSDGFVQEGILREAAWIMGRRVSLIVMSMLEEEYRRQVAASPTRPQTARGIPRARTGGIVTIPTNRKLERCSVRSEGSTVGGRKLETSRGTLASSGRGTRLLAFKNGKLLVTVHDDGREVPGVIDPSTLKLSVTEQAHVGMLEGFPCYATELADVSDLPGHMSLRELRPLFDILSAADISLVCRAAHVLHWHKTHRYCGECGAPTVADNHERTRYCSECESLAFPRISPAMIVAVIRDGAILLARGPRFRDGLYSVLAGFVEPGESLEDCVRREVREEVGIHVENVKYFGSQPWPFPDSLMIGFTADYAGGDIHTDGVEIVHAGWYRPNELPVIPSEASIARRLIDWFSETHSV
jgi:NAD+ diphosphatase